MPEFVIDVTATWSFYVSDAEDADDAAAQVHDLLTSMAPPAPWAPGDPEPIDGPNLTLAVEDAPNLDEDADSQDDGFAPVVPLFGFLHRHPA